MLPTAEHTPCRVLIVDDHHMVRQTLAFVMNVFKDLTLVGQAQNGLEAIHLCAATQPDIILMDLMMPEMDGVEAIRQIGAQFPSVKIVVLSSLGKDEPLAQAALQAGAAAHLNKQASIHDLIQTIRNLAQAKLVV
jgi:two-component system NarL family response regulator